MPIPVISLDLLEAVLTAPGFVPETEPDVHPDMPDTSDEYFVPEQIQ